MLSLDSPRWSELQHAYGHASDIPALLGQLESVPDSDGTNEPWFSIWSALAHQGDVYSASFAAVPHVVRVLASSPDRAGGVYFHFPAWVEICRQKNGTAVPPDLLPAYQDALAMLPFLVASAANRAWDDEFAASVLSAIAAAKGFPEIAEATMELTSDVAREVLDWLAER
jgi:hypothetical protein